MQLTKEQLIERRDTIIALIDEAIDKGVPMTDFSIKKGVIEASVPGRLPFQEGPTIHGYDGSVSISISFGRKPDDF